MKIILTGFEPFGDSGVNSSWEAAVLVGQLPLEGVALEVVQLPVSFKCSGEVVNEILHVERPDVLVMLGQRGNSQSIDIERIAVNLMDSVNPDNDGYCPQEQTIQADGKSAYFSNLPVKVLKDALLQKEIPARVSNSAGLYVCNAAYYTALNVIEKHYLPVKAVFVHVPKIAETLSADYIAKAVKIIIETILKL